MLVQAHTTRTSSLNMNGRITQSSCQVKPRTHRQVISLWRDTSQSSCQFKPTHHGQVISIWTDTSHSHVSSSPQNMDILVTLCMDTLPGHHIKAHSLQTSSLTLHGHTTLPTTHGQKVSPWMDTSPSSFKFKPTTLGQVVSLFMDTPSSHQVQAHSIWTSSFTMNGHTTQSPCWFKPTPRGQVVSIWMDTSPSLHVRSSPQHMEKKFHYEWTHHLVIMSGQTHNTWTKSLTVNGHITQSSYQFKPTTHGQVVSLWMDISHSHHVRSSPHHMDK